MTGPLTVRMDDESRVLQWSRAGWEALAAQLEARENATVVRGPRTSQLIRAALDRDRGAMVRVTLSRAQGEAVLRRAG